MKHLTLVTSILGLLSGAAHAADLAYKAPLPRAEPPPVFSWTGLYVGVNAGYGFNNEHQTIEGLPDEQQPEITSLRYIGLGNGQSLSQLLVATGVVPSSLKTSPNGGVFGGQVGYNYQIGNMFVVGAEADLQWSGIRGSDSRLLTIDPLRLPFDASLTTTGSAALDWYGTLRARAGVLVTPQFLLYGTGGAAFGHIVDTTEINLAVSRGGVPIDGWNSTALATLDSTKFGWVVGAGFEYAITPRWFVKTEYQFLDFGSHTEPFGLDLGGARALWRPVNFQVTQRDDFHIVKVGVNYKLY